MFALCVEASHKRGMGHLFRILNMCLYLEEHGERYVVLINDDEASKKILLERKVPYEIVDFNNKFENWERKVIDKYNIDIWLNDKFESDYTLCKYVKEQGIILAGIDDRGEGAELFDIHFAGMIFGRKKEELLGKKVYLGLEYNILPPQIKQYRRIRNKLNKIIVTLGGSDTYGVTVKVLQILKKYGYSADIVVGPNFKHEVQLNKELDNRYLVYHYVPSLMKMFANYDLAITGGGGTCIEANAAGLPCIIIANEQHEIVTGKYMEQLGASVFAGYYKDIQGKDFLIDKLDINHMSKSGIENISLDGMDNIYYILKTYCQEGKDVKR